MLDRRSTLGIATLLLIAAPFALAGSGDDHCPGGPAAGTWDLPSGDQLGHAHGALFTHDHDHPALVLDAALTATHAGEGALEGALFSPFHPDHGPLYVVSGHWSGDALGAGDFEAVIYERSHSDHVHGRPVGVLAGHFTDPPSDQPQSLGSFVGQWRICQTHD